MRIFAIVKRIINQFRRDKRTLALMFLAPLLLITLLTYLFEGDTVKPVVGVSGLSDSMVKELKANDLTIKTYSENTDVTAKIKDANLDAFFKQNGEKLEVTYENSEPSLSKEIGLKLQKAMMTEQQAQVKKQAKATGESLAKAGIDPNTIPSLTQSPEKLSISTNYVYGDKGTTFFDTISPIFIGFFVFFFVFLIAGISFLRERTTGTLERLMATPIKRIELELGYLIGFGIFALLQSILVAVFSIQVLGMMQNGSLFYVLLITLTLGMVSLALGILLSTFANNEFQIIPIVIVPQVLFCGIFPLDGMADWLVWIAHIMPLYYGANALTSIMVKGEGFASFATDFYILLGFVLVFVILNIFALKKYRKV
ncbi:TPA: ABC transporter permease [Listeria monocytogenes]|nr:ABC transporter permease [Listeria monocytogenes]HAM1860025.1 ABC transporter permease [Listeria monocytogenes]HEM1485988.1 ABC transporter permease [Listeria monocytogenes]HEM1487271.1 ABC transporter permease [Listeria monocytogenes]